VFLALVRVIWPRSRRRLAPINWRYVLALLVCCATSIASGVEARFLAPIFLLCALFTLQPGWENPLADIRNGSLGARRFVPAAVIAGAAVAFFVVVAIIVHGATDSLVLGAH
jgi:hypothetical protein